MQLDNIKNINIDDTANSVNGKRNDNKNKTSPSSPFKRSVTKKCK